MVGESKKEEYTAISVKLLNRGLLKRCQCVPPSEDDCSDYIREVVSSAFVL